MFVCLATVYCAVKYFQLREIPEANGAPEFTTNLDYYLNLTYTWLVMGTMIDIDFTIPQ